MTKEQPVILWTDVRKMSKFHQRLIGMLGEDQPTSDMAYWFPYCKSIHTWGMKEPIDVIALDKQQCIMEVRRFICPNEVHWFKGAHSLIETVASSYWPLESWLGKPVIFNKKQGAPRENYHFDCSINLNC
ncbi:hypothetical protein AWR38_08135 [Idiomarina sp. WRN-38]|jgi:hypothetical protein|uniref:DUF192 domain-containing protein n=1 Tax=unclassified Idiomarina TaxID=2614829 RepID=UPI0007335C48|nr:MULTISPECIES: DUF192 domain-containing protein [unclassified Idiomarina]KTG23975.1 hypothetical protein AUR68_08120 [Idiomarina sp. H105]MBF38475.1 hypothetical protein [Idiomarinaceae bacterium]OAE91366.1 hypothetical protein AWR38_08135 [Idiomarina sp. WRN-38]MCH2455721.1 DUF192 domain-containing protein [Idiomarina sp.]MCJ8315672.1 DUF192 domain-containing protein [Idiomarina sp.]